MPLDALTNFPNGITTSALVFAGEGEGEIVTDIVTIKDLGGPTGFGYGLKVSTSVDVTGADGVAFVGTYFETTVTGQEGPAAYDVIDGVAVKVDCSSVTLTDPVVRPLVTGFSVYPPIGLNNISSYHGLRIGSASVAPVTNLSWSIAGISVGQVQGDGSGAGIANNYGVWAYIPVGKGISGGQAKNYAFYVNGNGHAQATENWAFYNSGTAPSFFGGPVIQKPAVSTVPVNNGELTVSATSNTSLTVRLKGTDGTVRSVVLTLA